jgi:hypothetical protein
MGLFQWLGKLLDDLGSDLIVVVGSDLIVVVDCIDFSV